MKKLKASKDLFAIFYIVNWILSIIIAPLGGYAIYYRISEFRQDKHINAVYDV